MVCDDTQGDVCLRVVVIFYARLFAYGGDDVLYRVNLKHAVNALHNARKTFQTHTGVYVFGGKLRIIAVAVIIELRENVVPDFHIAVAIAAGLAIGLSAAVFFTAVKIDLRAGTAGTGAVLPEVVLFAEADDMILSYADFVAPD